MGVQEISNRPTAAIVMQGGMANTKLPRLAALKLLKGNHQPQNKSPEQAPCLNFTAAKECKCQHI
jgi:hypothetical protein